MPEPTDPLRERLAATPGLATLVAEARATWLARAERGAAGSGTDAPAPTAADDPATDPASEGTVGSEAATVVGTDIADDAAGARAAGGTKRQGVRTTTPRWRAFEDAFPTFYQFTNRPRR